MEKKNTFSENMRVWFRWLLNPLAGFFNRLGIHPNTMTLIGLFGTTCSAILLATGHITGGGLLLLVMGPVDALDGAMARLRGEASDWGAFVDSVTDRYAELVTYGGLIWHFLQTNNKLGIVLAYLAAAGSVLVSYVKARADAGKLDANVGLLTRIERLIVLIPCLILNFIIPDGNLIPLIGLGIIAVFANFTALQRIYRVRRDAYRRMSESSHI
jgi:CDP-diacylglycerol---glycerol-3-phosphate 3-phosphatidyltransferase